MKDKKELPDFLKDGHLSLRLNIGDEITFDQDQETFWTEYVCDIVIKYCDEEKEDLVIGKFKASQYHSCWAEIDRWDEYDAFGTYESCDYDQYSDLIWDHEKHNFSEIFAKATDYDYFPGDFFILMNIHIFPAYRGYDLGNAVTWLFYRNFCRPSDFLLLLAFPLQFGNQKDQGKCNPNEFSVTERECINRLSCYYKKLGFKRIGHTDFYFFNCENLMKRPAILDSL